MEASDTAGQPPQEPGQTDAIGQDQSQDEPPAAPSQEQPTQDSGLQTPQPDQPVPTEAERTGEDAPTPPPADAAVQQDESAAQPSSFPTNAQQTDAAVDREQELEAARRAHNARTGGGEIQPNEVQDARQAHNDRTGGGQIPGTSEPVQESEQPES